MKKILFVAMLAILAFQVSAQRYDNRDETLFSRSHRSGFFIAPIVEYSDFNASLTTGAGGGLGFIAGDFFIGAYGLGIVDYDNLLDGGFDQLEMGHGGLWLGYVFPQQYALHMFTSVKAGWGAVNIDFKNAPRYEDAFFAITPEAGIELNVFSWFRLAGSVGYRFMNGLADAPNFDAQKFEGMTGSLTFRIGGFGRRHDDRWSD
ncbi:MAG: hypothetical protein EPO28_07690 [Saprospiraceae bacterium]|nr:MAG: hypothetical protein EPO28_07690 [Saprospiraceae bacterium]